jgi:tripartite-type tricarboxylate transporter receptor subunit TctC
MESRKLTGKTAAVTLFLVLASIFLMAGTARTEYPDRPITLISSVDTSSPQDMILRALVVGAEKQLGKPLVIENKGGGASTVGLAILATAKPDGYTLCCAPNVAVANTPLMQKVTYKPLKSFTPILAFASSENSALLVKSDSQWKTLKEFVDYAKRNPGKIKYSTSGPGSGMHVAMEFIAMKEGIKWVHVPYKGTGAARIALLGGHVDACSSGVDWPPFVDSGQLRVLVTHGRARMAKYPDVPTEKELGYGFVAETIHSIFAPAGLPADMVSKLEFAFSKGMETPEFKKAQEALYYTPVRLSSKEYEQHLKEFWFRSEKVFKDMKIIKEAATQPY